MTPSSTRGLLQERRTANVIAMLSRWLLGSLCGVSVALGVSLAQAQCTKDTDCKGDRVCDGGNCVAAPAALPPAPPAPVGASGSAPAEGSAPAATPSGASATAPVAPAAPATATQPAGQGLTADAVADPGPEPQKRKRHSTGMMVGGIVMVSFAPIAFLVSLVAAAQQDTCEVGGYFGTTYNGLYQDNCSDYDATIYGGAITGVALLGVGIPLIVIGAKKEPAPNTATATISPWVRPNAAGVGLRLDM